MKVVKHPIGDNALHLAARKKDPALVKTLIEAGAQVDAQNSEGQTVLHLASILGDEDTVRVLFMARASPSITDLEDRVPIHLAAERGYSKYKSKIRKSSFPFLISVGLWSSWLTSSRPVSTTGPVTGAL